MIKRSKIIQIEAGVMVFRVNRRLLQVVLSLRSVVRDIYAMFCIIYDRYIKRKNTLFSSLKAQKGSYTKFSALDTFLLS